MDPRARLFHPILSNTVLLPLSPHGAWTAPWVGLTRADEQLVLDAAAQTRLLGHDISSLAILRDAFFEDFPAAAVLRVPHLVLNLLGALRAGPGAEDAVQCLSRLLARAKHELVAAMALDGHASLVVDGEAGASVAEAIASLAAARAATTMAARLESRAAARDYLHGAAAVLQDDHYSRAASLRRSQAIPAAALAAHRFGESGGGSGSVARVQERFLEGSSISAGDANSLPEPYGALGASALALVDREYTLRFTCPPLPLAPPRLLLGSGASNPSAGEYLRAYEAQLLERPSPIDRPVALHRICAAVAEAALLALSAPAGGITAAAAPLSALACQALELAVDPALLWQRGSDGGAAPAWSSDAAECVQALVDAAAETVRVLVLLAPEAGDSSCSPTSATSPLEVCAAVERCPAAVRRLLLPSIVASLLCGPPGDALQADDSSIALDAPCGQAYSSPELRNAVRLKRCSLSRQTRTVRVPASLTAAGEALLLLLSMAGEGDAAAAEPSDSLFAGWAPGDPRLGSLSVVLERLGSAVPAERSAAADLTRDARLLLDARMGRDVVSRVAALTGKEEPSCSVGSGGTWDAAAVIAAVSRAARVSLVSPGVGTGLAQSAVSVLCLHGGGVEEPPLTPHSMAVAALLTQVLLAHPSPVIRVQALAALISAAGGQLGSAGDAAESSESVAVAQWALQPLVLALLVDEVDDVAAGAAHALDAIASFCHVWLRCTGEAAELPPAIAAAAPLLEVAALHLATLEAAEPRGAARRIEEVLAVVRRRRAPGDPDALLSLSRALFSSSAAVRHLAADEARAEAAALCVRPSDGGSSCLADLGGAEGPPEARDPVAAVAAAYAGLGAAELPTGTLESAAASFLAKLRLSGPAPAPTLVAARRLPGLDAASPDAAPRDKRGLRSTFNPQLISGALGAMAVARGRLKLRQIRASAAPAPSSAPPDPASSPALEPELIRVLVRAVASPDLPAAQKASVLHQLRDAAFRDAEAFAPSEAVEGALVEAAQAAVAQVRAAAARCQGGAAAADGAERPLVCAAVGALHALVGTSAACRAALRGDATALRALLLLAFTGPSVLSSLGGPGIDSRLLAVRCLARIAFDVAALTGGAAAGLDVVPHELLGAPTCARAAHAAAVLVPLPAWRGSPLLRCVAVSGGSGLLCPGLAVVDAAQPIFFAGAPSPLSTLVVQRALGLSDRPSSRALADVRLREFSDVASALAKAVASASPSAFLSAVRALRLEAAELPSACADLLERCDVISAFYRFLSVPPQTPDDAACLAEVLRLLQTVVERGPPPAVPEAWQARAWALLALCDAAAEDAGAAHGGGGAAGAAAAPPPCAELAEYVTDPHAADSEGPFAGLPTVFLTPDALQRKAAIRASYWHHDQPRWRLVRAVLAFVGAVTRLRSGPGGSTAAAELVASSRTLARVLRLLALPQLDELTQAAGLEFLAGLLCEDAAARAAVALDGGRTAAGVMRAAVLLCSSWRGRRPGAGGSAAASFAGGRVQRAALGLLVSLANWSARHTATAGEIPVLLAPDLWKDPASGSTAWLGRLASHRDEDARLARFAILRALLCTPDTWAVFAAAAEPAGVAVQSVSDALATLGVSGDRSSSGLYSLVLAATGDTLQVLDAAADFLCEACRAPGTRAWAGSAAPAGSQVLLSAETLGALLSAARGLLGAFPRAVEPSLRVAAAIVEHAPRRARGAVSAELSAAWAATGLGEALFAHVARVYDLGRAAVGLGADAARRVAGLPDFASAPAPAEASFVVREAQAAAERDAVHAGARTAAVSFWLIAAVQGVRGPRHGLGAPVAAVVAEAARVLQQYVLRCVEAPWPAVTPFEHAAAADACGALTSLLAAWAAAADLPPAERIASFPFRAATAALPPGQQPVQALGSTLLRLAGRDVSVPGSVRVSALRLLASALSCLHELEREVPSEGYAVLKACGWLESVGNATSAGGLATTALEATLEGLLLEASSAPPGAAPAPPTADGAFRALWEEQELDCDRVAAAASASSSVPLLASALTAVASSSFEPREAWVYEGYALAEGRRVYEPLAAACSALVAALECDVPVSADGAEPAGLAPTVASTTRGAAAVVGAVEGLLYELSSVTDEIQGPLRRIQAASQGSDAPAPPECRVAAAEHVGICAALLRAERVASCLAALVLPPHRTGGDSPPPTVVACITGAFAARVKAALFATASLLATPDLAPHHDPALGVCERLLCATLNFASSGGSAAGWHLAEHADVETRGGGGASGAGDNNDGDADTVVAASSLSSLPHRLVVRTRKPVFARPGAAAWRALSLLDVLVSEAHAASDALLPRPQKRSAGRGGRAADVARPVSLMPSDTEGGLGGARSAPVARTSSSAATTPRGVDGEAERREARLRPASAAAVAAPRTVGLVAAVARSGWRAATARLHSALYAVLMSSAHHSPLVRQAVVARQLPLQLCERLYWALAATAYGAPSLAPAAEFEAVAAVAASELRFLSACASPADPHARDAILADAWFKRVTVALLLRDASGRSSPAPLAAAPSPPADRAARGRRTNPSLPQWPEEPEGQSPVLKGGGAAGVAALDVSRALGEQLGESVGSPGLAAAATTTPPRRAASAAAAECDARVAAASSLLRNCCGDGGAAAENAWLYDAGIRAASFACLRDATVGVRICAAAAVHGLVERSARVRAWLRSPGREPFLAAISAAARETAGLVAHLGGGPGCSAEAEAATLLSGALAQLEAVEGLLQIVRRAAGSWEAGPGA